MNQMHRLTGRLRAWSTVSGSGGGGESPDIAVTAAAAGLGTGTGGLGSSFWSTGGGSRRDVGGDTTFLSERDH